MFETILMELCFTNMLISVHANQTHFNINGFARRLVLKQRKWPITAKYSYKFKLVFIIMILFTIHFYHSRYFRR